MEDKRKREESNWREALRVVNETRMEVFDSLKLLNIVSEGEIQQKRKRKKLKEKKGERKRDRE